MKYIFIKEITKINDEKLGLACLNMVSDIPDYFWHVAASSTGKYHPQCDLGEGGLVRHSIMVATIADELVTSTMFVEDTPLNHDLARVAGLFHDVYKRGPVDDEGNYSEHTEFEHPVLASRWLTEHLEANNIDADSIRLITSAVASHMGIWNTSKYAPDIILPIPSEPFEKLIHTADYIASRKWIGGIW